MNFDCIVSQTHIGDHDVQGGLNTKEKKVIVALSIAHLRKWNPNAYIILTGHGHRPDQQTLDLCDHVYWEDKLRPMNAGGFVEGMPAQFFFVSKGIQHAIEQGFHRLLKTRTDCVIGIPEITKHCNDIIDSESKRMLLTQQTGDGFMGDCCMYGDINLLDKTWDMNNPVLHPDGLVNTAKNYAKCFPDYDGDWRALLKRTIAMRDVIDLKFSCLRWHYRRCQDWQLFREMVMDNTIDFRGFHWGLVPGYNTFDNQGNMTSEYNQSLWSKKEFYSF